MNRKNFLASMMFAGVSLPAMAATKKENPAAMRIPSYLKEGDTIGITAPAGYIMAEEILPAIKVMEGWGYKIKLGDTIGKRDFTFAGTDDERVADFQQMLDDKSIKAVMCARGGYGAVRIIDRLQWDLFKQNPKWIIGFSDITVFHSHLGSTVSAASIHSKMCNSFPDDWSTAELLQKETIESIQQALCGQKMSYTSPVNIFNRTGTGEGVLIGGNLKTLEALAGSASDIQTAGKILFVEDTGEYMYSIDRMFWFLKRTGKLSKLKGLIIGGFRVKVDEGDDDFGKALQDVVLEKVKEYKYPVCFEFPVGHQLNNFALKCGVIHRLSVTGDSCTLVEG
jgi:muramoyltetrapeptide carboxypeptidase